MILKMFRSPFFPRLVLALVLPGFWMLSGCNLPGPAQNALVITQTQLAAQATLGAQAMRESAHLTQSALQSQATMLAAQGTQNALVATQSARLTEVSMHVQQTLVAQSGQVSAPVASVTPRPSAVPQAATPTAPPTPTPDDLEARIHSARILVYENIVGEALPRYVKAALDSGGYTYVDTGDASGLFKAQLLSSAHWDLIIAAMESRSAPQGEFYRYLNAQIDQGTSVLIETWNLDDIGGGSASAILERCRLVVQSDWFHPTVNARPIWWLQPQNPIFHQPNEGVTMISPHVYWEGDAGDLLMLSSGSQSTLLGGVVASNPQHYGTIASCENGRLILQTFSSHDYNEEDVVALWQNYIYNALKAHFEAQSQ